MWVRVVEGEWGVECGVKWVSGIVVLCGVNGGGRGIVGMEGDVVENRVVGEGENVLWGYWKCMFREEGEIVGVIVFCLSYQIMSECGVCIWVVWVEGEVVGKVWG